MFEKQKPNYSAPVLYVADLCLHQLLAASDFGDGSVTEIEELYDL